jgi:hypothetical protein
MTTFLLVPLLWTLLGIVVIAVTWRRWRRVKPNPFLALFWTFLIAALFTPFIPHASVQWSTPWPPAFFWVGISLMNGDPFPFELFTILAATLLLSALGFVISRPRSAEDPAKPV